jgi:hypothetical protein
MTNVPVIAKHVKTGNAKTVPAKIVLVPIAIVKFVVFFIFTQTV